VLPYFKRSESLRGRRRRLARGEGPLHVSKAASPNPIYNAAIEPGAQPAIR
jgi:choline dehydrogenase